MERSEKDLESMCRRLVRFEESRLRMNDPDVSLELEIRKERDRWCGKITKKSGTGSCWVWFRHYEKKLGMLFVKIIWWISNEYHLLDIHLSDDYNMVLKPGMLEELDLKLSSLGY